MQVDETSHHPSAETGATPPQDVVPRPPQRRSRAGNLREASRLLGRVYYPHSRHPQRPAMWLAGLLVWQVVACVALMIVAWPLGLAALGLCAAGQIASLGVGRWSQASPGLIQLERLTMAGIGSALLCAALVLHLAG